MSKLPTSRLPITPSKNTNATKSGLRPPQQTSTNAPTTTTSQQVNPAAGDSTSNPLVIGDRVTGNGKSGTVAFIGPTKFADGEWIGIILDEAQGKNDGSYEGTRYFETEANRGLFCRSAKVQRLVQNGATNSAETSGSVKAQTTPPSDSSKVSTANSNLDKGDADTTLVNPPVLDTSTTNDQPVPAEPSSTSSQELHVGDRVVVSGTKYGTLKYLGQIHVAEGTWCGIQLDEPLGKNDGSVSGKRYFTCQQRYGLFSPLARVEKLTTETSQSQSIPRKESVSSSTNNKSQLHRSTSQESLHSNLSEFSTSSNSISRIPTRPPAKVQQQKAAATANLYATPNTKTLLNQAAATLAAATPTTTQISNLAQKLRERDLFIEKLQSEREQDRLEFSRAAQQVDEMESRLLASKQQYDIKEAENEQLKKEQYQIKQRLEDLEFQLEEYKLTDSNKEHSTTPTIPDGYRLLSLKENEIYNELKEKVLQLESINQKLILEKQTLQDEHRQDLKRQNEFNENEYKSRLNEFEGKYQNQQTGNLDTIKSEYEQKLNEKDQQTNQLKQEIDQLKSQITDLQTKEQNQTTKETSYEQQLKEQQSKLEQSLQEAQEFQSKLTALQQENEAKEKQTNNLLTELKRYQENLLPELEKQYQTLKSELTELQNRDRTANLALGEREIQFEQQLKEYQSNITEAKNENEKVRTELKQFQEANLAKEQENNDLIKRLKEEYTKVQNEFNELEQKSTSTLNERQTHFEVQIKDYQNKLEQSTEENQKIQLELTKFQEEKISYEKKSNEIITTLKQDYEKLQTEFSELQDRDRTQNMALNERETHYENQIKEYQSKRDQASREIQDLRNELTKFQEGKTLDEKQIQSYQTQISELENQVQNKTNISNEKDQQIKDYQTKLEQFQENQRENDAKLTQLQTEFDTKLRTQTDINQETENLRKLNEILQKDHQDLQTKYSDLQTECQKQLTSNEQLKNTNDNIVNEKQALIDQLTKQMNDLQQVQAELIEKQIKQHADFEQQQIENQKVQEKLLKEKCEEYEKQIQIIKSEFLVERENDHLVYEQERIRLKNQLQSSTDTKTSSGNVKQLEYELSEARYQIEKLEKQLANNAMKDDRTSLESQINFLNDVIVELRNTNEQLKKEIEFLKNPFVNDEEFSPTTMTQVKSSAPRLYCDMCEVFDQHDTDDCPKQSSVVDDPPPNDHQTRERVLPPARLYCEKCEQFDHDCEIDETF